MDSFQKSEKVLDNWENFTEPDPVFLLDLVPNKNQFLIKPQTINQLDIVPTTKKPNPNKKPRADNSSTTCSKCQDVDEYGRVCGVCKCKHNKLPELNTGGKNFHQKGRRRY
jgi:hypothetical protein